MLTNQWQRGQLSSLAGGNQDAGSNLESIISFIFVNFFFCSVLHFFSLFKSDFYPFACFSLFALPTFFNFARFFFFL